MYHRPLICRNCSVFITTIGGINFENGFACDDTLVQPYVAITLNRFNENVPSLSSNVKQKLSICTVAEVVSVQ